MAQAIQAVRPEPSLGKTAKVNLKLNEGWIAALLLAIMLISVTSSIAAANWTDGLYVMMWASVGGMLFGALVARLRLNWLLAILLSLIVGAAFVALLVSFQVTPYAVNWNEKMMVIEDHLGGWLAHVIVGGIGSDAFVFVVLACAVAWLIGYGAAWSVFRLHQPWGAILPAGALLLLNLFYAPPQSGLFLMIFLLAALLLLVRTTLLKRQQAWEFYAIRYANDIGLDFLTYGVVFSGLIILAAWLVPPTAPGPIWFAPIADRVRDPWQDFGENMTRAFSTLHTVNNAGPTVFFSNSLAMGGPIHLGTRPVFDIDAPTGRYWRAVVFDKYTGAGWVTTADQSATFIANDPRLRTAPADLRRVITETVDIKLASDNLVISASQPLKVSEPTNARYSIFQLSVKDSFVDLYALRFERPMQVGDKYVVESSLSGADEGSLRASSTDYPSYVREKYLPLPKTVPPRVHDLTVQITQGATNPYDKAHLIEQYLREHITYNDAVPPVPPGRDGVDYLLFDRPEGYCNYYASAMAVMARSIGIPARVASGYSAGFSNDGMIHVTEGNAHSWPELYLGEYGWVEFEPTAARPEIVRPIKASDSNRLKDLIALNSDDDGFNNLSERRLAEEDSRQTVNRGALPQISLPTGPGAIAGYGVLAALVLAVGALVVVQFRWTRRVRGLSPGARALEEVYRFAPWAGFREREHATPNERAAAVAELMPDMQAPMSDLTGLFVRERYAAETLSAEEAARAAQVSSQMRLRIWRGTFDRHITARLASAFHSITKGNRN